MRLDDDTVPRWPVHIPPLTGWAVLAWPLLPNPAAGGKLCLPSFWKLGDHVLAGGDQDAMAELAAALGLLLEDAQGEVRVEAVGVHSPDGKETPFTHRVHFTAKHWQGPPDWAVRLEVSHGDDATYAARPALRPTTV